MDWAALLLILRRELMTSLRSLKSAGLMLVFMVLMTWMASFTMVQASAYSASSAAMRNYFMFQAFALFFVAMGVVPGMAAVSLCGERESGGYDLLATTLVPPWAITLGKYLAVLAYFFLFCVAVLPFMGLVYFYAGLDILHFFDTFVWVLPPVPFNAAVGIWISGKVTRPAHAVLGVFGMIIAAAGLFLGGASALASLASVSLYVKSLQPAWAALSSYPWNIPLLVAGYQCVLAALFLVDALSQYRLSGALIRPRAAWGRPAKLAQERRLALWYRSLLERIPLIFVPNDANPFGYRDLYGNPLGANPVRFVLFALAVPLYLGTLLYMLYVEKEFGVFVFLERFAFLLVLPPLLAATLAKEREETTLDMYRMTTRPGAHLLLGKYLGILRLGRPLLSAIALCKFMFASGATACLVYVTFTSNARHDELLVFRHWFDVATLPLHIMLVLCVASMGAVFPRSPVAAVVAASACSLVLLLPTLFFHMHFISHLVLTGPPASIFLAFAVSAIVALIPCWMAFMVAVARLTVLWEPRN